MEKQQKKLVTISNYAKMLGLTRQTIHYRIKQGSLKSVKIDGKMFVELVQH